MIYMCVYIILRILIHRKKHVWKVIFNDFINLDFCTQFFCAELMYELNDFEVDIIET